MAMHLSEKMRGIIIPTLNAKAKTPGLLLGHLIFPPNVFYISYTFQQDFVFINYLYFFYN